MSGWKRVAVVVVCCGLLFGTFVHYEANVDTHEPYPDEETLVTDYEVIVGERTLLFGTVQSVDGDQLRIEVTTEAGAVEMTVPGADADVQPGGIVQVYGTLESGQTITPIRTVVVNESGGAERFKFAVSGIGALLVLVAVFRYWRIDLGALEVRPRG